MVCASHQLPVYIQTGATGALAQTRIPSAFAPLRIFDWRKLAQPIGTLQPRQASLNLRSLGLAWPTASFWGCLFADCGFDVSEFRGANLLVWRQNVFACSRFTIC